MTRILVVDLDGTLIYSDMLMENLFLFLRHNPLRVFEMLFWLFGGKANFKIKLADAVLPEVKDLPYNRTLIDWLRQQRSSGAKLVLAIASDKRIAMRVADHVCLFDDVMGCLVPDTWATGRSFRAGTAFALAVRGVFKGC